MTLNTKLAAYGVAALALTAVVDVLTGFGPLVLMCAYAGIVAAWVIESDTDVRHTRVDLKKAA